MLLAFLAVTALGVGAYAYTIYYQGTETLSKKTYKKIGEETNVIEATEPLTILLMGVDTGNVERTDPWAGNSDSMAKFRKRNSMLPMPMAVQSWLFQPFKK